MKRTLGLIGLVAAMMMAAPAMAQPMGGPGGRGGPQGARMGQPRFSPQQRAERRMKMLKQRVGLNDATAKRVVGVMEKYRTQQRALRQNMRTHRQKLAEMVKADSNDQAAYRREILALQQGRIAMQRLHALRIAELQRILTPKQQAKMLVMRGKGHRHHGMRGKKHQGGQHGRRGGGQRWQR